MTDPSPLHARALDLLVRGDTAGGIEDLNAYLATEPDDERAWLELGTAYAAIDHLPQATTALRRAVELDGTVADARLALARVLVRAGKLDDAAFQLLQAAKADPPDARVVRELGIVFYDRKLFDKAATWLAKAIALTPTDARAHYALGLAHEARRDMGAAVAAYREAVRCDPRFAEARRTLADALASMGEHEGAITELDALLAIELADQQAAHNRDVLARALEEMKQRKLLGKGQKELEDSALASEGGFRKKGTVAALPGAPASALTVRYAAPLVELYATFDAEHAIDALMLVLTDPDRAARAEDDTFKVTVIAKDGTREPVNFATAVSLTFLREALGCPMTQASELYARLLGGEARVEWAGAVARFDSVPRPDKPEERWHGIVVSRRGG